MLKQMLLEYAEQVKEGNDSIPIELQVELQKVNTSQLITETKSAYTVEYYRQQKLNDYANIKDDLTNATTPEDKATLALMYTGKYLTGHFQSKIYLVLKLWCGKGRERMI